MNIMNIKIADALRILGLGEEKRDQLFYWIKTKRLIKPEKEGIGRGKRSTLSIQNIIELAVVKELVGIGIELNFIRELLKTWVETKATRIESGKEKIIEKPMRFNRYLEFVMNEYRKNTNRDKDFYLLICKDKDDRYRFLFMDIFSFIEKFLKHKETIPNSSVVIVNLFEVLRNIENKIGEKI